MKNLKLPLIITAGILAVILACIFGVNSFKNNAISQEERVNSAMSDIKVYEKRRADAATCSVHLYEYQRRTNEKSPPNTSP